MENDIACFVDKLATRLNQQQKTLGLAESCTGGWLAKVLTDAAGSSQWFSGAVISYSNTVKSTVLSVNAEDIDAFGAVSETVVKQMAQGAIELLDTDYAVAISGVAGPEGGTKEKPLGTVWICVAHRNGKNKSSTFCFEGGRERVRLQSVFHAIEMLLLFVNENG